MKVELKATQDAQLQEEAEKVVELHLKNPEVLRSYVWEHERLSRQLR